MSFVARMIRLAAFAPASGRFTWNERERKFRDAKGKLVSRTRIRLALDEYLDNLAGETKALALRLVEGSISIGDWQVEMERIVKRGHTSSTAIAKGGWQQAKAADWARAAVRIKFNYGKLNQFARQLERDDYPLDGRFIRRAMMYALAPTGTYEDVLRADDIKAGFDRERRILHSKSPCIDCFRYAALGWQPAGKLPGIGHKCQCKANCRCRFERIRSIPPPKPPRKKQAPKPKPPPKPKPAPPEPEPPRPIVPPVKPAPPPQDPFGPEPTEPAARIEWARRKQRAANEAWKDQDPKSPGDAALRTEEYHKLRRKFPDLIPPGPIADRIKKYQIGDAKIKALDEIGARFDVEEKRLYQERDRLNKRLLEVSKEAAGMVNSKEMRQNPRPPEFVARLAALRREIDETTVARDNAKAMQESLGTRRAQEAHAHFRVADGAEFFAAHPDQFMIRSRELGPLTGPNQGKVADVLTWLRSHIARGDSSTVDIKVGERKYQRAFRSETADHIGINEDENPATIVHEYGHAIDWHFSTGPRAVGKVSKEFLDHRVGSEELVSLRDRFGGYEASEKGRKDKFEDAFGPGVQPYYVGKHYNSLRDSEILSMGLQKVYEDPVSFARADPEYFKYVSGIMDGSLR